MEKKKIDDIIENVRYYRMLREDGIGPTNALSGGNIAGTEEADPGNPPVDLRKRNHWNPFFKNLARVLRRKKPK